MTKDWTLFTSADGKVGRYKVENGMVHCEVQIDIHANQSAPSDKTPPLIQALHANGDRIAMEATIAQQAQRIADLEADKGHGGPVGVIVEFGFGLKEVSWTNGKMPDLGTKLYAERPAPVAVVMPEHRDPDLRSPVYGYARGWNACLNEFARLNSEPKP